MGTATSDKHGGNILMQNDMRNLAGDMVGDGAEEVFGGETGGFNQRPEVGEEPLLAQGFRRSNGIVFNIFQCFIQLFIEYTPAGNAPLGVVGMAEPGGEAVEGHVAGTDIKRNAAVISAIGDVGNAAEVEAGIVVREEEFVADGDEGCALAAEGDVEGAEIANHLNASGRGDGVGVADLGGEAEVGLVEDGVAMGGDGVDYHTLIGKEFIDYLSVKMA